MCLARFRRRHLVLGNPRGWTKAPFLGQSGAKDFFRNIWQKGPSIIVCTGPHQILEVRGVPMLSKSRLNVVKEIERSSLRCRKTGWVDKTIKTVCNNTFLPAFFAGLFLVLIMTSPGRTNLPDFFTSLVPISAKVFKMVLMSAFFNSVELANSPVRPPFVITFAVLTFLAFITAFVAFIAPAISSSRITRSETISLSQNQLSNSKGCRNDCKLDAGCRKGMTHQDIIQFFGQFQSWKWGGALSTRKTDNPWKSLHLQNKDFQPLPKWGCTIVLPSNFATSSQKPHEATTSKHHQRPWFHHGFNTMFEFEKKMWHVCPKVFQFITVTKRLVVGCEFCTYSSLICSFHCHTNRNYLIIPA